MILTVCVTDFFLSPMAELQNYGKEAYQCFFSYYGALYRNISAE